MRMTPTKRILISLTVATAVIPMLLMGILLGVKLLIPDQRGVIMLWVVAWPAKLIGRMFPAMDLIVTMVLSISLAVVIYIMIAAVVIFVVWQRAVRAFPKEPTVCAPPPPAFH